jgi:hypothetical protein
MKETLIIEFAGELRDFANTNACMITEDKNGNATIEYNFGYDFIKEHYQRKADAYERRNQINRILERGKSGK